MATTNEPEKEKNFKGQESSREPFEIEEPAGKVNSSENAASTNDPTAAKVFDGYISSWNPIPRLKQLLERLIPPRWSI